MPRDQLGNHRRSPAANSWEFGEKDGFKDLKAFSNSTATAILVEAPNIDLELFNARGFVERNDQPIDERVLASVKRQFPRLKNWFYDDELKRALLGKHQSERRWVNQVISARLKLPEDTIERYRRKRKPEKPRK